MYLKITNAEENHHSLQYHVYNDWALRFASRNGHFEVVKYLIEHGADIHACNDEALKWAFNWGHLNVVKILEQNG